MGSETSTGEVNTNLAITDVTVRLDPRSTCSRSVLLACAEMNFETRNDISYKIIPLNLGRKDQKTPEHLKFHPFGKVPVLVTNDIVLYESDAISRYLAENIPGSTLIPNHPNLRAQMDKLLSIYTSYFKPAFFDIYKELVLRVRYQWKRDANMDKVNNAIEQTKEVMSIMEMEFAKTKGDFFAGPTLSLADLKFYPGFYCLEETGKLDELLEGKPFLGAWNRRMALRESWLTVYAYKDKFFPPNLK